MHLKYIFIQIQIFIKLSGAQSRKPSLIQQAGKNLFRAMAEKMRYFHLFKHLLQKPKAPSTGERMWIINNPLSESKLALWWHALREWTHAYIIYSTTQHYPNQHCNHYIISYQT